MARHNFNVVLPRLLTGTRFRGAPCGWERASEARGAMMTDGAEDAAPVEAMRRKAKGTNTVTRHGDLRVVRAPA